MREIKFREWDKDTKKMYYNPIWYNSHSQFDINEELKDYTVMQYTGIKDKNGKEIYEGDIVKVTGIKKHYIGTKEYIGQTYKVIMTKYGVVLDNIDEDGDVIEYDNIMPYELEVIGNIYENPDLLN